MNRLAPSFLYKIDTLQANHNFSHFKSASGELGTLFYAFYPTRRYNTAVITAQARTSTVNIAQTPARHLCRRFSLFFS